MKGLINLLNIDYGRNYQFGELFETTGEEMSSINNNL